MPSYAQSTPHPLPWTVPKAQGALEAAAWMMLAATRVVLRQVYRRLERPDLADREEHRLPYDQATEILATIECTLEDHLGPAVKTIRRSSRITDAELMAEFEVEKAARRDFGFGGQGMTLPPRGPDAKNLGAALRILRRSANLNLGELGERIGMTRARMSLLENGRVLARYDTVLRIVAVLGLPMSALLEAQQLLCDQEGGAPGKYVKEEQEEAEPPAMPAISRETALHLAQEAGKAVAHCCLAFLEFQVGGWADAKVIAAGRQEGGRRRPASPPPCSRPTSAVGSSPPPPRSRACSWRSTAPRATSPATLARSARWRPSAAPADCEALPPIPSCPQSPRHSPSGPVLSRPGGGRWSPGGSAAGRSALGWKRWPTRHPSGWRRRRPTPPGGVVAYEHAQASAPFS